MSEPMTDAHKLIERLAERAARTIDGDYAPRADVLAIAATFAPLADVIETLREAKIILTLDTVEERGSQHKEHRRVLRRVRRAIAKLDALREKK